MATAVSDIRFEKPHSLSYQENPDKASFDDLRLGQIEDRAGLWLKSIETSGSSLVSSTPFREPVAACWIAPLISAISVSRAASNLKSMSETIGVGTRMEVPSSLPFQLGKTDRPFAAPSSRDSAIATPPVRGACQNAAYPLCAGRP